MEPGTYTYSSQTTTHRKRRLVIIAIVCVMLVALLYQVYQTSVFRITGTNPNTSSITTVTPFFKVSFNKPLSNNNISVTSQPSVINAVSVSGNTLDIVLSTTPMKASDDYTITIKNISDTTGQHITNKAFHFVPQYVSFNSLPKDQQQALVNEQDALPKNKSSSSVGYGGFDTMVSDGYISLTQEYILQQAFFQFDPSETVVVINQNTISNTANNNISFSVTLYDSAAQTVYKATISSTNNTNLELYLYNSQSNQQVYDSKLMTAQNN